MMVLKVTIKTIGNYSDEVNHNADSVVDDDVYDDVDDGDDPKLKK